MIAAGKIVIPVKQISTVFRLYTIGDIHLGNEGSDVSRLREDVAAVKADRNARAILMGDLADYIGQADKRWDAATITPEARVKDLADWGQYLTGLVVREMRPIAGQIIGALSGNHEATFQARQAQQLHAWTCAELGIPDFGFSCFFDLAFRRHSSGTKRGAMRSYRVFAHHGAGAAQSPGGKTNRLCAFMNACEADLYLVGHVHEKDVKRMETLSASYDCTKITSRKKLGVFTGTYLKTYSPGAKAGYGERAGYRPVPLGCSVVEFHPFCSDWMAREESVSARVSV